jgi:hypothetical protein
MISASLFTVGIALMLAGMSTWPDTISESASLTKTGYALGWIGLALVTWALARIEVNLIMLSGA